MSEKKVTLNQILKDRKVLQVWRKGGVRRSPSGWGGRGSGWEPFLGVMKSPQSCESYLAWVHMQRAHMGMGESPPENLICQHPGLRGEKQKPASR